MLMMKMFAKIVKESSIETEIISETNYEYEADFQSVYQQSTIIIPEEDINKANCQDCAVLIGVQTLAIEGTIIDYSIQATQVIEVLTESRVLNGYVEKNSNAYYAYDAKPLLKDSSVMFVRADNNKQCANMYLGLYEYPGRKAAIAETKGNEILTYYHTNHSMRYFLTIEGRERCEYTITVMTSESLIVPLERGKQHLMQIPLN